jgi:hypothetical protein
MLQPFSHVTIIGNSVYSGYQRALMEFVNGLYRIVERKEPKEISKNYKYLRIGKTEVTCRAEINEQSLHTLLGAEAVVDQYNRAFTVQDIAHNVSRLARRLDGRPVEVAFCGAKITFAIFRNGTVPEAVFTHLHQAAVTDADPRKEVVDIGSFWHSRNPTPIARPATSHL